MTVRLGCQPSQLARAAAGSAFIVCGSCRLFPAYNTRAVLLDQQQHSVSQVGRDTFIRKHGIIIQMTGFWFKSDVMTASRTPFRDSSSTTTSSPYKTRLMSHPIWLWWQQLWFKLTCIPLRRLLNIYVLKSLSRSTAPIVITGEQRGVHVFSGRLVQAKQHYRMGKYQQTIGHVYIKTARHTAILLFLFKKSRYRHDEEQASCW